MINDDCLFSSLNASWRAWFIYSVIPFHGEERNVFILVQRAITETTIMSTGFLKGLSILNHWWKKKHTKQ